MEVGMRIGLARSFQADQRINDARYHDQEMKRARGEAESKAKAMADDFDFMNAKNAHDNPIIKENAKKHIQTMGKWYNENRGWETDVNKRAEQKMMLKQLNDNPDLHRGNLSDAEHSKMIQYQSDPKNAELTNSPEFERIKQEWKNYEMYGHQEGEEGLKRDGGKKAFVFSAPDEYFDYREQLRTIGSQLGKTKRSNAETGYSKEWVDPKKISDEANAYLTGAKAKYLEKGWNALTPEIREKTYGNNIKQYTEDLIRAGITESLTTGIKPTPDRSRNNSSGDDSAWSAFLLDFKRLEPGKIGRSPETPVVAPVDEGKYTGDGPVFIMSSNGVPKPLNMFKQLNAKAIPLTGYMQHPVTKAPLVEMGFEYDVVHDIDGIFSDEVNSFNNELHGPKGSDALLIYNSWGGDADPQDLTVNPLYKDQVQYNPKTGKLVIRNGVWATPRTDLRFQHKYDKTAMGQKDSNEAELIRQQSEVNDRLKQMPGEMVTLKDGSAGKIVKQGDIEILYNSQGQELTRRNVK
jgi:hypothetical protein